MPDSTPNTPDAAERPVRVLTPERREALQQVLAPHRPVEVRVEGKQVCLSAPGAEEFTVDVSTPAWPETPDLAVTQRALLHSLDWVRGLYESGHPDLAADLWRQYAVHATTPPFTAHATQVYWAPVVASRLRTASWFALNDGPVDVATDYVVSRDIQWVRHRPNIPVAYPGLLVTDAVFCLAATLYGTGHDEPGRQIASLAGMRLRYLLRDLYGDDYWNVQSSPTHMALAIDLVERALTVHRWLISEERAAAFDETLAGAKDAAAVMVFPEGDIIPRGHSVPGPSPIPPSLRSASSTKVGVWVHHGPRMTLMVTAGGASAASRHRDDQQVVLRYAGQDVFVDGGHTGTDKPGVVARLRSPRSHSVLAPLSFDKPPTAFGRRIRRTGGGKMTLAEPGRVETRRKLPGSVFTWRNVELLDDDSFRIEDSWKTTSKCPMACRYLLPQEFEVDVADVESTTSVRLHTETHQVELAFDAPVSLTWGVGGDLAAQGGWRAVGRDELVPALRLEARLVDDAGTALTTIVRCSLVEGTSRA